MANQRTTSLPVRVQQILSGGRAVVPSLKLESDPPPDVKGFIDRVIKCPLHDIAIPLSGFRWEYSKGNFHHWRPLFIHFDTYFKKYLSCRKDLLLAEGLFEDDAFPKHSVLQILRVMQIILDNCHNKSSFSGLEHFKLLLSSTDPDILIAALETLSALVRINPSRLHNSVKPIGCGSLNNYLLSLAQGWGSKEEGLGLFSCVMANERNQHDGLCLFPMEVEDGCNSNQYRLGSTLYFEFHAMTDIGDCELGDKGQPNHMRVINIPDLHLRKEDDLMLLKQCIDEYNVPLEHRFSLLTRIRYAHAFHSPRTCRMYSKICILAFIVLVQSNDAHDELVSFFAHEPEYTNELIRLVRSENSVPGTIKALAMFALGAQLAAYTSSHERARIFSGSNIISAGGNRMVLLTVLQKAILSLENPGDPTAILFVEALLQFFLLHVLSSSSSGSAIRGSGMVSPLLPLLRDTNSAHVHLVYSAVKTLQKLMEYSNPAVTLFKDLGGVELLVQRLQTEVSRVVGREKSSSTMLYGDSLKPDDDILFAQKRLIKILLKALVSTTYSPTNSARSQSSHDNTLPGSLSIIFKNAEKFGGDIYFSAVTVMSEMIHKDPTCFNILFEHGLPDAFLMSVSSGILPSSKALMCIPGALGAICLNAKGLEAVKESGALRFLIDVFTTKKYLVAMNEGVVLLANAVEELLRHVSSLRSVGVDIIIEIIDKLACLGESKCHSIAGKADEGAAMEVDADDKDSRGQNLVGALDLATDGISNDHFVQLCIFHAMVLVHRTMENSETCRLFVEKKGIDAMMKLLLQPSIAESTEGTPIALHSTIVFKGFAQHHSAALAHAFCSVLRDNLKKALSGFGLVSSSFLLNPKTSPDRGIFSPLFVIEFLLFLATCKDHRWMTVLLTEFGNENKDVLEDIGRLHREVLWQIALLEDARLETEDVSTSGEASSSGSENNRSDGDEHRFSSIRQYIDPLLRRRVSGWPVESQFLDLISMYRDIGRAATNLRRPIEEINANLQLVTAPHSQSSGSQDADSMRAKKADKQKSYYSSCRDVVRSLSYHISHLFLELGKAMLLSSRRGSDPVNVSPAAKSVVSIFASVALDHLNFRGHSDISSEKEVSVSTKCRYLGKVIDFIDVILMEKPDSCNPILVNCFFVRGVVEGVLTTFEATSQLLFAVNRLAASPMEMDDEHVKQDAKEEADNSWIYGPLASYDGLMDHLATSAYIISSFTKPLLEQPIVNGDVPFPRDPEAFVKVLQSKVLKAVLPLWNDPRFTECKYEFIAATISIIKHVYLGAEVLNISGNSGIRTSGPPPDESTISLIVEMGFSRSRAEEALRQVGTNSVELATDWLFSHPEEPQEDDELARALKLSLGSVDASPNENATDDALAYQEVELTQLPQVDELLSTCIRLLHASETFAFPVRDLLVTIATEKEGECRPKVIHTLINQLKLCSGQSEISNVGALSAFMHVLALVLNADSGAREIASSSGLIDVVSNLLSRWEPVSCNGDKIHVPKWVTASFLAIDQMLQINPNTIPEITALENPQSPLTNNGSKVDDLKFSLGVNNCPMQIEEKKRFIEIACKCIKSQLPSDTMHVVVQLCATLTKDHSVAVSFLDAGGLTELLRLPTSSLFPGFDNLTAMVIRHILEDPQTLQQAMESEIKHSLLAAANRHANGRVSTRSFVQSLASVISRDPAVFMRAAQSTCQIEVAGDRQYVVLLKDREKEKIKEKSSEKEKQLMADGKSSACDAGSLPPEVLHKSQDCGNKGVKSHRKPPQSFTSVIELLLDVIVKFVPPPIHDDLLEVAACAPSTDMDIDSSSGKGKGKAVAISTDAMKSTDREASASLAKSVFILKLLTEVLMTYTSSIHVILRKDAEINSFRGFQKGSSANGGGGMFHHILHEFLPYTGMGKKDKKTDGDWRYKLSTRANKFLVASCVRSSEARKRIFSEIHNIFIEFVDSSSGCKVPDSRLHAFVDLLNDILAGRSSAGSYISAEASVTFIDAGLVRSLTRTLQVLDLDHADSSKVVTGIVKALELVTKEHAHSTDHGTKNDSSVKAGNEQNEQMRIDTNGNRFLPLETTSQPDHGDMVADHMDTFNAAQTSIFSDSVTDDMDHDRDMEGGFTPEEDDFMHEPSEAGRSLEDGVSTVEISFEIQRNVEDNMGEEDDDEDMSGDDVEGDGEDDEDDEENNDLEEDNVHHMSHPDTDQEDHEIDEEEFDEDVEEEDEDEEDDGVILRLEEGANGINVFDEIELLGPRGNTFSNDTLRVMPLEVFGSRRQGRGASIYNSLGRASDQGLSSEHPLLVDPSSRQLVQRQSENAVDAAFSDRGTDNTSSRLDTVFRSLRNGRQHRLGMWGDDVRQRGGSGTSTIPRGIEELLISHLRRPTIGSSDNNATVAHAQETNQHSQLNGLPTALTEDSPEENLPPDAGLDVRQLTSVADVTRNSDIGDEQEAVIAAGQVTEMQYDRNDATVRDMEAVSLESGGSSATLGESLRSLDVEIGSADGHDDAGHHGDQTVRARRSAGGSLLQGNREILLESVSEVPAHPIQETNQDNIIEEQQVNRNVDTSSIDPTFLEALPEELRAEVLSAQQNQGAPSSNDQPQTNDDIDPEFLAALPPDIRAEVLAQQQAQRLHQSQELEGQPVEMDTVSIIATFPSELREEVLLTSPDAVLASLTPALVAEANLLRERFAHRYHGGNTFFGVYPRNRRGEPSRRGDAITSSLERGGTSRRPLGNKIMEAEGAPLVDAEALRVMIRLLRVVQPLYKGQLQKLLLNLCVHHETRRSLVQILMDMLMLDVQGNAKSSSSIAELPYRLYGCPSHISYSRPQFSNGLPPLVSRRILETLKYLAQYHPSVAKLLLHIKLPIYSVDTDDHGRGKAIAVLDNDCPEYRKESGAFVLLLSLLNQPLYLRSIAHLEQLLSLLDVIVGNAENDLYEQTTQALDQNSGPTVATQDASMNMDLAGPSTGEDAKSSMPISSISATDSSSHSDTLAILVGLPQSDMRQLCSLLAREGLSDSAYVFVADVLKKLVAIVPDHCHLFIRELANAIESLSFSAVKELEKYEETEKAMLISSSTDGTAILRVLQALSSLVSTLHEKNKGPELQDKDHKDVLSVVGSINGALEPLWLELSNCISKIECSSESISDFASRPSSSALSSTGTVPPLPMGTQNILPYIESFFVTCEKLHAGLTTTILQEIGTPASDREDAANAGNGQKASGSATKVDERHPTFVKFSEKHRKLLNAFVRQNPGLLEKSFSLLLKVPRFIDFDNKRSHFRSKIKHLHDHHHSSLRISVRRAYILEDSYHQLRMRSPQELKGRLTVHFQGEEGIDAGGLTREWYQVLSRVIFDKGALLFTTVGNESTFQPNPNSVFQTEHLSYFKFVGRVVGKALFDGQLLDVHFTRSFYKHILGVKVTYHDIEAIDPDYYKNLKWMLENDISDVLGLTFSIDADEEKLILYERSEVTDYELKPGGRNIRVTEENKHEYVDLVAEHRLTTAIRPQINAFMEGFSDLIHKDLISIFNDRELELLISGLPDIDLDDLRANTEYSGYTNGSPVTQWFWDVVQGFSKEDKARLLQFVTGTSKVPLEGFSALQGISGSQRFQIHKAYGSPEHLPSAHTCFNQLDLPEYPSKDQLQERLLLAIHEGNEGFGFG